ncbi:MAG: outer membrane protein assembly factor [Prevotellaceae bacterium]|jgi:hypothetical protein|nr:outer membrane protein assembly factor [Prevotellaceae bacterium]
MKKRLFLVLLLITAAYFSSPAAHRDSVKTGWNVGMLPALSFDSNLGFQYGGIVNFFYYGDGSTYPHYQHSIYAEVSQYTKGSTIFRTYYDSKYLLPGLRTTVDMAYVTDKMMKLHGFNGYKAAYIPDYVDKDADDYISEGFYSYNRKLFRVVSVLQGAISGNLRWAAGLDFYNFDIGAVDKKKLDLPEDSTAYEYYASYGGLPRDEVKGGSHIYLKGGLVYDTRNFEPNPMKGMCTELLFLFSPDIEGRNNTHAKITLVHRQYFTILPQNLSFAYRIGYQGTLFGHTPWYLQQNINVLMLRKTLSEGLGSSSTMRGSVRNRIVGDGVIFANAELRWKFLHFKLIKQNWYLSTNPFVDMGMIVQPYRESEMEQMHEDINTYSVARPKLITTDKEAPHVCVGAGFQLVMNQNFIISADFGKALDKRDGNTGLYIGLNYLF